VKLFTLSPFADDNHNRSSIFKSSYPSHRIIQFKMVLQQQLYRGCFRLLSQEFRRTPQQTVARNISARMISGQSNEIAQDTTALYLHVGPSGDCWTGHSIFAAKHLQPDYVKSVKLEPDICVDTLLEVLEENDDWARQVYDDEALPDDLLDRLIGGTEKSASKDSP
jgi:hypothetical protein